MVTKGETEKIPVTDNIAPLTEKLEQISLDCSGQFNVQSLKTHLKTSSQFGNLRQHSLTNSHQVIQIQGKYFKAPPSNAHLPQTSGIYLFSVFYNITNLIEKHLSGSV